MAGGNVALSLLASVFGGSVVSVVTYVANRGRLRAETAKLEAETERTKAETQALLASIGPAQARRGAPPGWGTYGRWLEDYTISVDRTVAHGGSSSALIEAAPGARGFATLMPS